MGYEKHTSFHLVIKISKKLEKIEKKVMKIF